MGLAAAEPHAIGSCKRMKHDLQACDEPRATAVKQKSSVLQVEGNDDLLLQVLKHADAKSLASACCVSRRWQKAAEDEALWEGICARNWPKAAFRPQRLKSVVLALGGFRRLYVLYLRPLLTDPNRPPQICSCGSSSTPTERKHGIKQWSKNEIQLSLSLFSIDFYERLGRRSRKLPSLELIHSRILSQEDQIYRADSFQNTLQIRTVNQT
eukprot:c25440_g1_i1 orf=666-1298(-)